MRHEYKLSRHLYSKPKVITFLIAEIIAYNYIDIFLASDFTLDFFRRTYIRYIRYIRYIPYIARCRTSFLLRLYLLAELIKAFDKLNHRI